MGKNDEHDRQTESILAHVTPVLDKMHPAEHTVESALSELRGLCEIAKADGIPPKARQKAHFALYMKAAQLGASFDDLDAAVKCVKPSGYNYADEPDVIAALTAIQKRADGQLGADWMDAIDEKVYQKAQWQTALKDYRNASTVESIAFCKVISDAKVSLDGKGKDGADLDVPFTLAVKGDKIVASAGRGSGGGSGSGPSPALSDGTYQRKGPNDTIAKMAVSNNGSVFKVTAPVMAEGTFKSATKAAVTVSPLLGYASHSHNGRTFWGKV